MTSTIADEVSAKFNSKHPELGEEDPAVLMAGFRAAGWTCCATVAVALLIALIGMRGVGLVGQQRPPRAEKPNCDIEMMPRPHEPSVERADPRSETATIATLADEPAFADKVERPEKMSSEDV